MRNVCPHARRPESRLPPPVYNRLHISAKGRVFNYFLPGTALAIMSENGQASLSRWQDKGLLFDRAVRQDWRLLELDEKILTEVIYNG